MQNIDDYMQDLLKTSIVEDAMGLLNDGYPLDENTKRSLQEVNIDPERFVRLHKDKTDSQN